MDLFIGNLSAGTDKNTLKKLFLKFCKSARIKFLGHPDYKNKRRYACVDVLPIRQARRAIRVLNNTFFEGKVITVREYQHRACFNERRAIDWRNREWTHVEKRTNERRDYVMENISSGVQLVEMPAPGRYQAAPRAKDKKTRPPVRQASRDHQA